MTDDRVEVECPCGGPAHFDCGLCAGSGTLSLKPVGPDAVALRVGRLWVEKELAHAALIATEDDSPEEEEALSRFERAGGAWRMESRETAVWAALSAAGEGTITQDHSQPKESP